MVMMLQVLLGLSKEALNKNKAGQVASKANGKPSAQEKLDAAIKEHSAAQEVTPHCLNTSIQ